MSLGLPPGQLTLQLGQVRGKRTRRPVHSRGLLALTPGCDSVDVIIIIYLYRLNSNTLKKEEFGLLFLVRCIYMPAGSMTI